MNDRIGFISTRFAGTDGVSLESAKWAQIFEEKGFACYWYAGRLDKAPDTSCCIPEAYFNHPEVAWINERIWRRTRRDRSTTHRIHAMAAYLKDTLYDFIERFDLTLLVMENVLSIPMHVPLGLAISELLSETHIPAIAHHHDFYWERSRYSVNAVNDYLDMAFPSRDYDLKHVVINQQAQEELARRKAVPSMLVPNVLDFEHPPVPLDAYASDVRSEMGLAPEDIMILQPTRVVPRKGIEHAINLVQLLGDTCKCKLVVTHEAGDEGLQYRNMLREYARQSEVDLRFFETRVSDTRQLNHEGKKMYTLGDIYPHANLVTYPSLYEGFGNAFLESIYFKIPLLINRYAIFGRDIEPKGFRVPVMDGFVTNDIVEEVRHIIQDPAYRRDMVDHNYRIAARHYSYHVLRIALDTLLASICGVEGGVV